MSKPLTVADLIHAGRYQAAVARMQELCRIGDPDIPVDADQVRKEYEAARDQLKAVVPPAPFKVTVQYVNPVPPGGAR